MNETMDMKPKRMRPMFAPPATPHAHVPRTNMTGASPSANPTTLENTMRCDLLGTFFALASGYLLSPIIPRTKIMTQNTKIKKFNIVYVLNTANRIFFFWID